MKKTEREIYQVLANEVDFILCSFCKFAEGDFCCGGEECKHPLNGNSWRFEKEVDNAMSDMGDCWGFRPKHPIAFFADIVGVILERGWNEVHWWQEDGSWKIAGRAD